MRGILAPFRLVDILRGCGYKCLVVSLANLSPAKADLDSENSLSEASLTLGEKRSCVTSELVDTLNHNNSISSYNRREQQAKVWKK